MFSTKRVLKLVVPLVVASLFCISTGALIDVYEPVPTDCPAVDGGQPVYFPAVNCSKFWECSDGMPYLFTCPTGLIFDENLEVCDLPAVSNCTGQGWSTTNRPETTSSLPTTESTISTTSSTEQPTTTPSISTTTQPSTTTQLPSTTSPTTTSSSTTTPTRPSTTT
ncbi:hypothetical protein GWI33_013228, partial [Rhynchophorus ferrugineus]